MNEETKSLWLDTTEAPRHPRLAGEVRVDVAIVGAGITGLTAALLLKQRGRTVALLEKNRVAAGESGYTTAHITESIDARYHYVKRHFGADAARLMAEASRAAIEQIAANVEQYGIDCHFRRVPGYLYTEKRRYVAGLKNEAASARDAGVAAKWLGETETPLPFPVRGAVLFENQAQFHPRAYCLALAARIPGDGSHLFEDTFVTNIEEGEPCVVETASGRVLADHVLQATDIPIAGYQTVVAKVAPYRTYAIAYPWDREHPEGLFWDTAEPYHYTRWQTTDAGTFVIIGGSDHKVGHEENTEKCFSDLQEYAAQWWSAIGTPSHRWSGQVIEPADGLPFIGGSGRVLISTGYSGHGMTLGTFGAMLATDIITGIESRFAELFDPKRLNLRASGSELVTENLDYAKELLENRVLQRDVEATDAHDVKSGEGKIILDGGRKIAAYRDDSGTLHRLSPICTHMGCDVAWNTVERSWDCPCHGSRFTPEGEVLHGPADAPLKKL